MTRYAVRAALCGLALPIAVIAVSPRASAANTRTATVTDGVDPTATYDLQRVRATLDRSRAQLRVSVKLHRPFPTAFSDYGYSYQGVSIDVRGRPSVIDCRYGSDTVGAVHLSIGPTAQTPTQELPEIHEASAHVSYRQLSAPVPLSFSPDRRTATVTVDDELLHGADLRCLSAGSSGRVTYDPRQPFGGPSGDGQLATYFAGFSPRARLKRSLGACDRRFKGRKHGVARARCKRRARERLGAAL
jgi:hypothetical protein